MEVAPGTKTGGSRGDRDRDGLGAENTGETGVTDDRHHVSGLTSWAEVPPQRWWTTAGFMGLVQDTLWPEGLCNSGCGLFCFLKEAQLCQCLQNQVPRALGMAFKVSSKEPPYSLI